MQAGAPSYPAYHQHVRIIEITRGRIGSAFILAKSDAVTTAPGNGDIPGGTPGIDPYLPAPFPNISHPILAKTIKDISPCLIQGLFHDDIGFFILIQGRCFGSYFSIRAPIIFQVIDPPAGISSRILLFVLVTSQEAATGAGAGGRINSNLSSQAMYIIAYPL